MVSQLKAYTLEEVATHNKESDCWIVFNGGVYDVTNFLKRHPGGKDVLLKFGGKDGTKAFNTKGKGRGHAQIAVDFRESLKIGVLKDDPNPKL